MILPLDATTTPKDASEWTAMIQFGGYIISGIIPMLVGVIKDVTNTFDVALFALLFIIVVLMLLTLKVKTKTKQLFAFFPNRKVGVIRVTPTFCPKAISAWTKK